ncbi:hypothetical protein JCM1841_002841 [Sporobolomyces salmonicolor]
MEEVAHLQQPSNVRLPFPLLPSLPFRSPAFFLLLESLVARAELMMNVLCLAALVARSAFSPSRPPLPPSSSPIPPYLARRFRNLFPGFGIAVVAFTAYVAYDETVNAAQKKDHHGAGHH